MSASPVPKARYNGLTAAEPTLPSRAYFGAEEFERDLAAIWQRNWIHVCRSAELAAPLSLQDLSPRHAGGADRARRARRAARLPQHLPASRLAALRGERRPAEGAADHLPLPRLVLFAARRAGARAVEIAAGRFRQGRLPALSGGAVGMARLCLRQSRRRAGSTPASSFDPASGDLGNWPLEGLVAGHRFTQGDELQLEDFLGKLQRVPALPGRAQASVAAGADLRPRPDGAP